VYAVFVFSVKTTKKQLLISALCVVTMVALTIAVSVSASPIQSTVGIPMSEVSAETNEQRIGCLNQLGYEIVSEPIKVQEIRLPDEADSVLEQYNVLLKQAGMDLTPYYGKRIKCYSYRVLNHADGEATAHLYVYRNKIVAGHIETADGHQLLAAQTKPE